MILLCIVELGMGFWILFSFLYLDESKRDCYDFYLLHLEGFGPLY